MEQKFRIENDNGTINVNFIGIPLKEDIDIEEKRKFLSNLFNHDRLNSDIIRVIQYLRTVLRDFDEKTLNIELYNFGTHIDAKFKNKKVISLKKENISEPLLFKFYYDRETGVSFHTTVDDIVSYKYVTCKDKNIVADILGLIDEIDITLEDEEDMITILNTINNKAKNKTYIKTK